MAAIANSYLESGAPEGIDRFMIKIAVENLYLHTYMIFVLVLNNPDDQLFIYADNETSSKYVILTLEEGQYFSLKNQISQNNN